MKRTRYGAMRISAAALALTLAAACGSNGAEGSNDGSGTGTDGVFRIGAGLALTGGFANFDTPALEGLNIAIEEINDGGGLLGRYPIEMEVMDVRSDPGESVIVTRELLADDPSVLIVACMTDAAIPQGQLAQAREIPAFSTCATSTSLTESVGDFMFGNFPPDTYESTATAQFALEEGHTTAFVISSPESSYTANAPKAFAIAFEDGGGEVVGEATFSFAQQDFGPIVSQIKNMSPQPDLIQTGMFEPAFPAFMKQLRAAGVETPVFGTAGIDTPSVVSVGSDVEGVILPSVGIESESPALKEFNDKLRERVGEESVTSYATRGYDLIKIIEAAVEKADSTDPVLIRDALLTLEDVEGLSTTTSYDYEGANRLPLIQPTYIARIQDGNRELVSSIELDPSLVPDLEG